MTMVLQKLILYRWDRSHGHKRSSSVGGCLDGRVPHDATVSLSSAFKSSIKRIGPPLSGVARTTGGDSMSSAGVVARTASMQQQPQQHSLDSPSNSGSNSDSSSSPSSPEPSSSPHHHHNSHNHSSAKEDNCCCEAALTGTSAAVVAANLLLNNSTSRPSDEELALLAKLEEANRLIECDAKSLNSLSGSGHSRKSSDTSQISVTSGTSSSQDRNDDPEEDLWGSWGRVVNDWETCWKKRNQIVRELVRKGIPHHFRGIVWQLLCGAHESPVKKQYSEYIKATSACEKVIRRDIARTYPEHDFFKEKDGLGQESLFNVMKAYSLHDREVGYCQGSAFIVGLLLMQMPEEEAFAVLVKLMQDYKMRDMFKPTMAELGLCMYQLENLVQEHLPEVNVHFQSQSFHTSMYASSWFLTLFTTSLPLPIASRIMDVFLSENMEIIFKIALALLTISKDDLLSLDMEGMLKYFQKDLPAKVESDPDGLMVLAYNVKINSKKMKKLEKDYTVMKTKEQEEMVELRRLRTENRLLKQRIEVLEAESSSLADRLIQGQVCRAEEEETAFVIKRELAAVRQHDLETNQQLEQARERIQDLCRLMEETGSMEEMSLKTELLQQKEELIQCLQKELVSVRLREAENEALIRDLRGRIQELEEDKKTLRETTPDNSVAHLQEELIAVKLREAEASLSLKELRQKVCELTCQWQKHVQDHSPHHPDNPHHQPEGGQLSTPKKLLFWENNRGADVHKLEEELMTVRLREMEALTELKELRLKVMELETQVQVSTNQLRRQDEENKGLHERLEQAADQEKRWQGRFKEQMNKYTDLESRMKEELMMARIRDAENTQCVVELTQKISGLKLKNHELVAEGELRSNNDDNDKLQDKLAEYKAEGKRSVSIGRIPSGGEGLVLRLNPAKPATNIPPLNAPAPTPTSGNARPISTAPSVQFPSPTSPDSEGWKWWAES